MVHTNKRMHIQEWVRRDPALYVLAVTATHRRHKNRNFRVDKSPKWLCALVFGPSLFNFTVLKRALYEVK